MALDGAGRSALFRLSKEPRTAELERDPWPSAPNPTPSLEVALALCKGSRFESAIEGLAELGVARLTPLLTERTERKPPSESRMERWRQIAASGSALAGRLLPLEVCPPIALRELLSRPRDGPLFFGKHAGAPLGSIPDPLLEAVLAIGPEGGFSPGEQQDLERTGAVGITLGSLNLRVETAALAFVARLQERFGGNEAGLRDT